MIIIIIIIIVIVIVIVTVIIVMLLIAIIEMIIVQGREEALEPPVLPRPDVPGRRHPHRTREEGQRREAADARGEVRRAAAGARRDLAGPLREPAVLQQLLGRRERAWLRGCVGAWVRVRVRACVRVGGRAGRRSGVHLSPCPYCSAHALVVRLLCRRSGREVGLQATVEEVLSVMSVCVFCIVR